MMRSPRGLGRVATCWLVSLSLLACAPPSEPAKAAPPPSPVAASLTAGDIAALTQKVSVELDDLHAAAAAADEPRYFGHYAANAIFLGTDAKERWDMAAFRAYAHPHFAEGKGWSYKPVRRAVSFTTDGQVAYFDEDLANTRIGDARGSGVLVRDASGRYLVLQYNLALTIPNERVARVHAIIAGETAPSAQVSAVRARYKSAYDEATALATAGDLAGATAKLTALVADAKAEPTDDLEFWLHNELTWLAWAKGDLDLALAEVEGAHIAVEHATLPEAAKNKLRLHERWDRAYVLFGSRAGITGGECWRRSSRRIAIGRRHDGAHAKAHRDGAREGSKGVIRRACDARERPRWRRGARRLLCASHWQSKGRRGRREESGRGKRR